MHVGLLTHERGEADRCVFRHRADGVLHHQPVVPRDRRGGDRADGDPRAPATRDSMAIASPGASTRAPASNHGRSARRCPLRGSSTDSDDQNRDNTAAQSGVGHVAARRRRRVPISRNVGQRRQREESGGRGEERSRSRTTGSGPQIGLERDPRTGARERRAPPTRRCGSEPCGIVRVRSESADRGDA